VDLAFATHLAAGSSTEWQILSSTTNPKHHKSWNSPVVL
jgi:hypothetical protein